MTSRDGRLTRQLFTLFLAVALVPLLVSGLLSTTAISQLAERLQREHLNHTTKQVSHQVLDRLLLARAELEAVRQTNRPPTQLPRAFSQLSSTHPSLAQTWQTAEQAPAPRTGPGTRLSAHLRLVHARPDGSSQVLMALGNPEQPDLIGEVDAHFLWEPIALEEDNGHWRVEDHAHHPLRDNPGPANAVTSESRLFLDAELGAGEWTFRQQTARAPANWQGMPLPVWLTLIGTLTLLGIAFISHVQIRRTLAPLAQLTSDTRRLAAGGHTSVVQVKERNEIGDLAEAFNDMAARIREQFHAIKGLAAVDQGILAGKSPHELAHELLHHLARHYPHVRVMTSWIESGNTRLHILGGNGSHDLRLEAKQISLTPDQWRRYIQSPMRDEDGQGLVPSHPWLAFAQAQAWPHCLSFPVQDGDKIIARITVCPTDAAPTTDWQHLEGLRDRLSVAFATRRREQELAYRAVHDSLTGLANRYGLHDHLDQQLAQLNDGHVAVLFVDLDHFKDVNDSLGHEAGDELLCLASERLQSCLGPDALLARRGGDEFVIVQPGADEALASQMAAQAVALLGAPFTVRGRSVVLGGSVGVAVSPQHGRNRAELLRCADVAMYQAKAHGRGCHALYAQDLDAQSQERVRLQAELRQALLRHELRAHYQPRVRSQDGRVLSAEALVRWQHPTRGLLLPGHFIPLAEESHLIEDIGLWMLDAACQQMADWRAQGAPMARVSVNVSPRQLATGQLVEQVQAALQRHQLPATSLELEVTESLLVGDARQACQQLAALRSLGVMIALDDFGTGYSSLAILRQLPVDIMKVDRAFVKDLGQDEGALAVTQAIVGMAQSLGLHIVAEGMETAEQARILIKLGCHELQGFYFSRPVTSETLIEAMQQPYTLP
ncbi:putative bifunctional diguanylate cyclase/phosphodiesterase [Aquabacterium sp.]|uniref:putative bifunctional diguanylate cyclase/phosphodiesterase n=1 Tax=Aquabacterium sp. TaxID=1872578 RepID=UPI0035AF6C4D